VYIVTGGGSGIGQALAWQLAERGQQVLICGRRKEQLNLTKEYAPQAINYITGDLTEKTTIENIKIHVSSRKVLGLIQNAGQILPISPLAKVDLAEFKKVQAINVEAPLALFQSLQSNLVGGRVLHLSSAAAHYPFHSWGAYCISKASFYMLYQMLKTENNNIYFGSVMPGVTDTNMQSHIRNANNMPTSDREYFNSLYGADKLLKPKIVAQFLTWLLLDIESDRFSTQEWDIYKKEHHPMWLKDGTVADI